MKCLFTYLLILASLSTSAQPRTASLPSAGMLQGGELLTVQQGGMVKKATVESVVELAQVTLLRRDSAQSWYVSRKRFADSMNAVRRRIDSVAARAMIPGPKGDSGARGPQGIPGVTGSAGPAGAQGIQGATGPAGPQGVAGATGAIGPQGATGPQGPTGATGAKGDKGDKGDTGNTGAAGTNGTNGINGTAPLWSKSALISSTPRDVVDTFSITSPTPTITLPLPTGCTVASVKAVTGIRAGAAAGTSPQVAITSWTATTVTLIVTQGNTTTVSIAGIGLVGLGPASALVPDPQNVKIRINYAAY